MGERIGQLFSGFAAGQAATGGAPRPSPRPTMPGTTPAPGTGQAGLFAGGGGGGMFGGMSPQDRHQMVMQLIGSATQQAQGASPLANMLAPIAGAVVGGMSGSKLGEARTQANQSALDTIMQTTGGRLSPQAMDALAQLENSDMLSDPIQSILRSTITDSLKPPPVGRGGGGGGGRSLRDYSAPDDPLAGMSAAEQRNLLNAEQTVREAVQELVLLEGMTQEEAEAALRTRPGWGTTFQILDRYRRTGPAMTGDLPPMQGPDLPPAASPGRGPVRFIMDLMNGGDAAPGTSAAPAPVPGANVDPNDPLGLRQPPA